MRKLRLAPLLIVVLLWVPSSATAAPTYPIVVKPERPVGTILLVHAGAWSGPNPSRVEAMRPVAQGFARARWRAVVIEYGAGKAGYRDLKTAVRKWAQRRGPLSVYGESAGGHLAALAAVRPSPVRRKIDGVISVAAPLDFDTWNTTSAAAWHREIARHHFGDDAAWNPRTYAHRLRAPFLAVSTANDEVVPPQQARSFGAHAGRRFRSITLAPGSEPSGHGSASAEELARARRAQLRLLRAVARRASAGRTRITGSTR